MARILLADDDLSTRQFLSAALQKAGHEVVACEDGLAAWAAFENAPMTFDLLLTDIVMPGIDGIELSERTRAACPFLKVIYITGFAAMAQGAENARVIVKPFHLGSITAEIEDMLKA
jgi:two-component system, cell cycle response regulator CpdR